MRVSCVISSTILLVAAHSFVASPVLADTKPPVATLPPAKAPAPAKPVAATPPAKPVASKPAAATPPAKPVASKPAAATPPAKPVASKPVAAKPVAAKPVAAAPPPAKPPAKPVAAAPPPAKPPAKPVAATPPPPPEQTPKEKAATLLDAGRKLLDAHEAERATSVLEEAYGVLLDAESGFELMRAYADVGKLAEAITLGEKLQTLSLGPKDPPSAAAAQQKIKENLAGLTTRVSTIQLQILRPAKDLVRVKVDEQTLLPEQLDKPIRVNPGNHELRVTAPGYQPLTIPKVIDKGAAQQYPVKIEMVAVPALNDTVVHQDPAPEVPSAPLAPLVKVGIGVSGGLGVVAIVTGIAAGVSYVGFVDAYNGRACGADCDAEVARRRPTLQGLSITSLVTGVLAVGAGTATWMYARNTSKTPEQASIHVAPTAGGIVVYGRW